MLKLILRRPTQIRLTEILQELQSTELQRIREERKPQQLLRALTIAIEKVAKTAGFTL
jgi:hypothetical protein